MQFSWKVLLFVCVAALAVEWNRAASLEEIGADTARELAAVLEELSSLRDSIAAEKVPIAERLNDLENRTRVQRGYTTFASSLVPRPRPALSRLQYGMQKQLGGCSPQKNLGIFELHRSILRLL